MKEKLQTKSGRSMKKSGRYRNRLLILLACLVVCFTSYALVFPAVTLEGSYTCGKEAHCHGVSCYASNDNGEVVLVCEKEEHVHDEHCLVTEPNPERYICGYSYEHRHEAGCYRDDVLVCTLVEHTHTEECLAQESLTVADAGNLTEGNDPAAENIRTVTDAVQSTDISDTDEKVQTEPVSQTEPEVLPEESEVMPSVEPADPVPESGEPNPDVMPDEEELVSAAAGNGVTRAVRYYDLREEEQNGDAIITFSVTKNGVAVEPSLIYGPGYQYFFQVESEGLFESTNTNTRIYYYQPDPVYNGCTMMSAAGTPLEQYASDWQPMYNKSGQQTGEIMVTRDSATGQYQFNFKSENQMTVFDISGNLAGDENLSNATINKSFAWNPQIFGFAFTASILIPHAVDNYAQYYCIYDRAEAALNSTGEHLVYDGFTNNASNPDSNFTVTMTNTRTSESYALLPIEQAQNDDSCQIAYYLEKNGANQGNLYLFNRSAHLSLPASSALHNHGVTLYADSFPGWCLCWQQMDDMIITISYNDMYGRQYMMYDEYKNTAYLDGMTINSEGKYEPVGAEPSTVNQMNKILSKSYDESGHAFTIVINGGFLDFGTQDITLIDTMTNGKLPSGASPSVSRMAQGGAEELLTVDQDYDYTSTDINSFEITIHNPGSYQYLIRYPVERIDSRVSTISNAVSLDFQGGQPVNMNWSASWNYGTSSMDVRAHAVTFIKEYELGIPATGATFTLFRAFSDRPDSAICVSKAANGSRDVFEAGYEDDVPISSLAYPDPSSGMDTVVFSNLIRKNTVYYIMETEAPSGYRPLDQRFYFCFTDSDTAPSGFSGSPTAGGTSRQDVKLLSTQNAQINNSTLIYTLPGTLLNETYHSTLPETGSSLGLLVRGVGIILLLSPAVLILRNKKRRQ